MVVDTPLKRNLFISETITQASMKKITQDIVDINDLDEEIAAQYQIQRMIYTPKPIKLYIDSYGGQIYSCFGLLGIIEKSKTPIHTIVTGCACSAAFLISITGHKRYGYDKSTFMYHEASKVTAGKLTEIKEDVDVLEKLQVILDKHVIDNTKISLEKLNKLNRKKKDWYVDSKKAIKLGIIDEII